jgi:hypothetical protein
MHSAAPGWSGPPADAARGPPAHLGRLAQLVRAPALQAGSHWFESGIAHCKCRSCNNFHRHPPLVDKSHFIRNFPLKPLFALVNDYVTRGARSNQKHSCGCSVLRETNHVPVAANIGRFPVTCCLRAVSPKGFPRRQHARPSPRCASATRSGEDPAGAVRGIPDRGRTRIVEKSNRNRDSHRLLRRGSAMWVLTLFEHAPWARDSDVRAVLEAPRAEVALPR